MLSLFRIATVLPIAALAASPASAALLYANNFDGQALGAINGQSAQVPGFPLLTWQANGDASVIDGSTGPQPLSGYSMVLRTAATASTNRSASFLAESIWLNRPAGEDVVSCSISMRIAGGQANQSASFGGNAVAAGGGAGIGFRVSAADGAIGIVQGDQFSATGAFAALGAWNTYTLLWNTVTEETSLLVNGEIVFSGVTTVTADFRRFTMVSNSGSVGGNAGATFDNYLIESVPAPGAASVMLLGMLSRQASRRRRR